ncbi:plexin-A1-like [Antedon mediterranea]|uniref:plexin-A1-like n=1 Tax=Antedon mediterranea TaxID=105859 RepID=UPI003AF45FB7
MLSRTSFLLNFIISVALSKSVNISDYLIHEHKGTGFNHVTNHKVSGNIYIAATNFIFLINNDFELVKENSTCSDMNTDCENVNKILTIDYVNNRLITCGDGNEGRCERRSLDNLEMDGVSDDNIVGSSAAVGIISHHSGGNNNRLNIASVLSNDRIVTTRKVNSDESFLSGVKFLQFINDYDKKDSIQYVAAFNHGEFTYFVSNRKNQSRISRFCSSNNDDTIDILDTFSEVYLRCIGPNNKFDIVHDMKLEMVGQSLASSLGLTGSQEVLFGVFSNSTDKDTDSVLCMFTLKDIEDGFFKAVYGCYKSGDQYKLNYVEDAMCLNGEVNVTDVEIKRTFCDPTTFISTVYPQGIESEAVTSQSIMPFKSTELTSVSVAVENDNTIGILGTQNGDLIKVHINNRSTATEYERMTLDKGYPIKPDTIIDANGTSFTFLTENKLLKIRSEICGQYMTCDECVGIEGGADPYCGWCTLESRCSRISECSTGYWIASGSSECIAIQTAPDSLPISNRAYTISLSISQLPPGQNYTCKFDNKVVETKLFIDLKLACGPITQLPVIPPGQVETSVLISVHIQSGLSIISTEFPFYNCSAITSCSECADSPFDCSWCPLEHTCAYGSGSCSMIADVAVNSQQQCPQIALQTELEFFHTDMSKKILINANNLLNVSNYICVINGADSVSATRIDDKNIICDNYTYVSGVVSQEENVTIEVAWNNVNYIDFSWKVTLYDCSVGRTDCSSCLSPLTTPPEYNCTWCNPAMCVLEPRCSAGKPPSCPPPIVNKISPQVVPTSADNEYVDVITLTGQDLGQRVEDLNIEVGGKPCKIRPTSYQVAKEICCEAPSFPNAGSQSIKVMINGHSTIIGNLKYQTPTFSSVQPSEGIEAGGTVIKIRGNNLYFSSTSVSIDKADCDIIRKDSNEIECKTGTKVNGSGTIMVKFGNVVYNSSVKYFYQPNPTIYDYNPKTSIKAGGRIVRVNGSNFQYVQDAKMRVEFKDNQIFESNCTDKTQVSMICSSPAVEFNASRRKRQADNRGKEASVKFVLDGFFVSGADTGGVTFFPDPVYYIFTNFSYTLVDDDGFYTLSDQTHILLFGVDLELASDKSDVTVFVGDTKLKVEELGKTYVRVALPKERLDSTMVTADHNNIHVQFGEIRYLTNKVNLLSIIIACTVVVFIIIIAILTIRYLRKSHRIKSEVKNIRLEMEELEMAVQEEAREAIADLALGLTDITDNLKGAGMPFLSHRDYACSMLFTGFEIVPDSFEIDVRDEDEVKTSALLKFSKLLLDKQFLLAFIRMMNNNRKMTIREKGNFASLLTVAMIIENKMEYMTEILEILLKEYIEDHVYSKKAKQVLIRNETVTEKLLSNWIALSMYNYLKYHAAFPLYLLFQAIKCRIKMGPVDAVSHYSTYSLSIDHILPSGIDYKEITLVVVLSDEDGEQIEVKVLTCDSISQVKMRFLDAMYKNSNHSDRPMISEVDLEWRNGKNGHLVLHDKDATSQRSGRWQKINTLGDFGVTDRSIMALVMRKSDIDCDVQVELVSPTSNNSTKSQGYQNVVLTTENTKQFDFQTEEGMSYYHLVKEDDFLETRDRSAAPKEFKRGQTIQYKRKKMVKEINFPKLVATKNTIEEYVDDMFKAIMKPPSDAHKVPLAIKYLFDLFDKEGKTHDVDGSILKTWKNNSFLARFWVQVITHPNFIFDIAPMRSVEVALDIISRMFLDSCSAVKIKFTKKSPVNRLLYTKEIENYRPLVDQFYSSVRDMPDFTRSELVKELEESGKNFSGLFSKSSTLSHLHLYAEEHYPELIKTLEEDEFEGNNDITDELRAILDKD